MAPRPGNTVAAEGDPVSLVTIAGGVAVAVLGALAVGGEDEDAVAPLSSEEKKQVEEARLRAEREAAEEKVKAEEEARLQAEREAAEEKAKADEEARLQAEREAAEEKAKAEEEARLEAEREAARAKAEEERTREEARLLAEREAARAQEEEERVMVSWGDEWYGSREAHSWDGTHAQHSPPLPISPRRRSWGWMKGGRTMTPRARTQTERLLLTMWRQGWRVKRKWILRKSTRLGCPTSTSSSTDHLTCRCRQNRRRRRRNRRRRRRLLPHCRRRRRRHRVLRGRREGPLPRHRHRRRRRRRRRGGEFEV